MPEGAAVHIIRYDYDRDQDGVLDFTELCLNLRLEGTFQEAEVFSPSGSPTVSILDAQNGTNRLQLHLSNIPLYTVVLLKRKDA